MPPFPVVTGTQAAQHAAHNRIRQAIANVIDAPDSVAREDEHIVQALMVLYDDEMGQTQLSRRLAAYLLQPERHSHEARIALGTALLNVAFLLKPEQAPGLVTGACQGARFTADRPPGVNPGPRRGLLAAGEYDHHDRARRQLLATLPRDVRRLPWMLNHSVPWTPVNRRKVGQLIRARGIARAPRPCWEVVLDVLESPVSWLNGTKLWLVNQASDEHAQDLSVLIGRGGFGQSQYVLKVV